MAEDKDNLQLSLEDVQKAISFLKEKSKGLCPMCGNNHLEVANHLVAPTVLNHSGGQVLGGTSYPMVMTFCTNCYHVAFHAAVPMGLLKSKAEGKTGGAGGK